MQHDYYSQNEKLKSVLTSYIPYKFDKTHDVSTPTYRCWRHTQQTAANHRTVLFRCMTYDPVSTQLTNNRWVYISTLAVGELDRLLQSPNLWHSGPSGRGHRRGPRVETVYELELTLCEKNATLAKNVVAWNKIHGLFPGFRQVDQIPWPFQGREALFFISRTFPEFPDRWESCH